METKTRVKVSDSILNEFAESQIVNEVNSAVDFNQSQTSSETSESGFDLPDGHDVLTSPFRSAASNDEGGEDSESGRIEAEETETAFEEVEGWQPKSATESDPESEAVVEASFGSVDPNNGQEFFGFLLPLIMPAIKALAPTVIKAATGLVPKILPGLIGVKKPKVPANILAALKSFNVPPSVLKMLETGEAGSDEFSDGESSESGETNEAMQQQIEAMEMVIGADDRVRINDTTKTPWKRICHLRITAANGKAFLGTGFFIGPRTIVTAGHCVYLHNEGGWAKNIVVTPGRNAAASPFNSFASSNLRSVKGWVNSKNRNYDYGVIILPKTDKVSADIGSFGFGNFSDAALIARKLNTAGYPGDKPSGTMWYHGRKAKSLTARTITYDIDTAGGQSGSPVWMKKDGKRIIVGIHTNGAASGNSATRVTKEVFDNLKKWRIEGGTTL